MSYYIMNYPVPGIHPLEFTNNVNKIITTLAVLHGHPHLFKEKNVDKY